MKKAFTLAEVLITLGIIGVVAAMTIPTLIAKYQERQIVSQLTKAYAVLSNAYTMVKAEYGDLSSWGLKATNTGETDENGHIIYDYSANKLLSERFQKYLKVSKVCEIGKVCYPGAHYNLAGVELSEENQVATEEPGVSASPDARMFLQDGTYIEFGWFSNNQGSIMVTVPTGNDVIHGKNTFYFVFNNDKFVPEGKANGYPEIHTFDKCDPESSGTLSTIGRGCAAWVLYNKNLDYMHCREKLSWDGAHSCKEAK